MSRKKEMAFLMPSCYRSSLFEEKHRRDFLKIYSSIAEMTTLCYTIREFE